jgi:hypothetical protein
MTARYPAHPAPGRPRPQLAAGRLWAGGLATALVAALIAAAGIAIVRGVFGVPILARESAGVWGDATTTWYAGAAAVAALLATALMHAFAILTPRPLRFFAWVMVLVTTVLVLAPFASGAARAAMVATAVLNLILGVAIGSLVAGTARDAMRAATPAPDPYEPDPYEGPWSG